MSQVPACVLYDPGLTLQHESWDLTLSSPVGGGDYGDEDDGVDGGETNAQTACLLPQHGPLHTSTLPSPLHSFHS